MFHDRQRGEKENNHDGASPPSSSSSFASWSSDNEGQKQDKIYAFNAKGMKYRRQEKRVKDVLLKNDMTGGFQDRGK